MTRRLRRASGLPYWLPYRSRRELDDERAWRDAPTPSRAGQLRLGLTWLDELLAAAFVDGYTAHLLEMIKDAAKALVLEGAAARERLLARHTAVAAVTVDLLVAAAGAPGIALGITVQFLTFRFLTYLNPLPIADPEHFIYRPTGIDFGPRGRLAFKWRQGAANKAIPINIALTTTPKGAA